MKHPIAKRTAIPKNNLRYCLFALGFLLLSQNSFGQSNYKESSNNFALYTQSGDIKHLENAKKFTDASYKTRRDSSNVRMNVLRAMVYSSIAYADSTQKIKTDKDPIEIANNALSRLRPRDKEAHYGEISYINQNLAAAYIYRANKALNAGKYEDAYGMFLKVRELQPQNDDIVYNLALLAKNTNKPTTAIEYYKEAISLDSHQPTQYLELAKIYGDLGDQPKELETLENGRMAFPENKDILFALIKSYTAVKAFAAITPIIDEAIKHEPENVELNYLAGYAYENEGDKTAAKKYYEKTVLLDRNNYEANLALGLLYLEDFLKDENNQEAQYNAQDYLLKANEIKPHEVNALKSLALYYKTTEDVMQLDRVNMLLNRIINN